METEKVLPQDLAGPPVWSLIHYIAAGEVLAVGEAQVLMECIIGFFPCPHCRAHGIGYLSEHPVTLPFFDWTVQYHNSVNKRARKTVWTIEQATREYTAKRQKPAQFGKALKILLYNLSETKSSSIAEVKDYKARQHQQLQMLVSLLSLCWPIASERSYFQSLSITQSNAAVYLYTVLRTVPSIQSEFPKRVNPSLQAEFVTQAKQMLKENTKVSSSSSSSSANSSSSSSSSSITIMVWIIVILSLFLVLYFAMMLQRPMRLV